MKISEADQKSPFEYDQKNGLINTVDVAGNSIQLSLDEIPQELKEKIIQAEKRANE